MSSPVDAIRINNSTWSWSSVSFTIDGLSTESIVSIDHRDELELRIVESNLQDQIPLGMSLGRYQVARFPLRMLRDSAVAFKRYLTSKAPQSQSGSYGQASFTMTVQLSFDLPVPSTTVFVSCRVVGESIAFEESLGALVAEFQIACIAIVQDGNSLFDATGQASAQLPGTNTITIAGSPAPGKWTLLRGPKIYGWDERKGTALSGATLVPTGDELLKCRFLVEIWEPTDYLLFKVFRTAYLKKALVAVGGALTGLAIGIDHPELKDLGATYFVPKEVNPLINDGFGVWGAEIEFWQYRKPLPALSKPAAAIPDTTTPAPTAETQTEIELQSALSELAVLPPRQ